MKANTVEDLGKQLMASETIFKDKIEKMIQIWLVPLRQSLYDRKPLLSREQMNYFTQIEKFSQISNEFVCRMVALD